MKSIVELLKILKEDLEKNGMSEFYDGLCLISTNRLNLPLAERTKLNKYIKSNKPENIDYKKDGYGWPPKAIEPRLTWLSEEIEKN